MHHINAASMCVCVDIVNPPLFACHCLKAQWAFLLHSCMHDKHRMHVDQHTRTRTAIALSFVCRCVVAVSRRDGWKVKRSRSDLTVSPLFFSHQQNSWIPSTTSKKQAHRRYLIT